MISRAVELRPLLRESQAETEALGAPPIAVHEAFLTAGLYRALQPRRFGGYEFTLQDFARIVMEIARGCPSTGWYYAFSAGHTTLVAQLFSEQTQYDAFAPDGDFLAPGRLPMGTAVPAERGWLINGRWDYCSGAPHANYFLAMVLMASRDDPHGKPSEMGVAIIPRDQWTMLDDWGTILGLKGSGSNSVVIENQVIPEHMLVRANLLAVDLSKPTPGYALHRNPLYAGRLQSLLHTEYASWAVGSALAMLDEYEHTIRTRETYTPPLMPRFHHHQYQRVFGLSLGLIDTAEAAVLHGANLHREFALRGMEGGELFSALEDMRILQRYHRATELVLEAVDLLWRTAGSSAARDGSKMQRYYRDFAVARGHVAHQFDLFAEGTARVYFDLDQMNLRARQGPEMMESRLRKTVPDGLAEETAHATTADEETADAVADLPGL